MIKYSADRKNELIYMYKKKKFADNKIIQLLAEDGYEITLEDIKECQL